jgi:hypothetical protein
VETSLPNHCESKNGLRHQQNIVADPDVQLFDFMDKKEFCVPSERRTITFEMPKYCFARQTWRVSSVR